VHHIILQQANPETQMRLRDVFQQLVTGSGLQLRLERPQKTIFKRNFRDFVSNGRALLRMK